MAYIFFRWVDFVAQNIDLLAKDNQSKYFQGVWKRDDPDTIKGIANTLQASTNKGFWNGWSKYVIPADLKVKAAKKAMKDPLDFLVVKNPPEVKKPVFTKKRFKKAKQLAKVAKLPEETQQPGAPEWLIALRDSTEKQLKLLEGRLTALEQAIESY